MATAHFDYEIDAFDVICATGTGWAACVESGDPYEILGSSLWDHIHGQTVCAFFHSLIVRIREVSGTIRVPYRCDTSAMRRFLELELTGVPGGHIQFTSFLIKAEPRTPIDILASHVVRNERLIVVCSMCKRLQREDGTWVEIEDDLERCAPNEAGEYPMLSHGFCPECYENAKSLLSGIAN